MYTIFWLENLKERDHLEDLRVDSMRMGLGEIGWESVEWIHLVHNMDQWWALVNTVMNLRVP
jgi:hypothetical protein